MKTHAFMAAAAAAAAAVALTGSPAQAAVQYGFDTDAQGWTVEQGGRLTYVASGGNPGGYLEFADISSDDMLAVLALPGVDWSAYRGGTLSFDARNLSGNTNFYASFGQLTFSGQGVSTETVDVIPLGEPAAGPAWHHYTIPLTDALFGPNLATALGQVTRVTLRTEFATSDPALFDTVHGGPGFDERVGIDNIQLAAVPEPASWALMLGGGLLALALRRSGR